MTRFEFLSTLVSAYFLPSLGVKNHHHRNRREQQELRKKWNVGILLFDDAEVLDFAGPYEIFSVTSQLNDFELFNVFTIAKTKSAIRAVNGLSVNPDYDFDSHPPIDILIIAGGQGSRNVIKDKDTVNWVLKNYQKSELTASICSGSRVLAVAGLLDHKEYCTHHEVYEHMKELVPTGIPRMDLRFVQSSQKLYTSGGITAGMDLSFFIVEKIFGTAIKDKTARYMEYRI